MLLLLLLLLAFSFKVNFSLGIGTVLSAAVEFIWTTSDVIYGSAEKEKFVVWGRCVDDGRHGMQVCLLYSFIIYKRHIIFGASSDEAVIYEESLENLWILLNKLFKFGIL